MPPPLVVAEEPLRGGRDAGGGSAPSSGPWLGPCIAAPECGSVPATLSGHGSPSVQVAAWPRARLSGTGGCGTPDPTPPRVPRTLSGHTLAQSDAHSAAHTLCSALPLRQAAPGDPGYVSDSRESLKAYTNTLSMMAGSGVLQFPYIFAQGGWATGALLVVMAHMANATGKALVRCLHGQDNYPGRVGTYAELGFLAFGRWGERLVHITQKATIICVAALFLILIGIFVHNWVPRWSQKDWILIVGAAMAPHTILLPTVSSLGPLSIAGSLGLVVLLAAVVAAAAEGDSGSESGSGGHDRVDFPRMPVAFAGIALSFGGHANFPSIEEPLAHRGPGAYCRVLDAAFGTLMLLYAAMGAVGYAAYGSGVESPVTETMSRGPMVVVVEVLIIVNLFASYPILMHALFGEVEAALGIAAASASSAPLLDARLKEHCDDELLPQVRRRATCQRWGARLGLIALTVLLAWQVPYFADFVSFIGGSCGAATVYIWPPLFWLRLQWAQGRWWQHAYMVVVLCVGAVGGCVGAALAVRSIVADVRDGSG